MIDPQYECFECDWIGIHAEMGADSIAGGDDCNEIWSNWICPGCGHWGDEDDYKVIVPIEDFTLEVEIMVPDVVLLKEIT